jgi:predicted amidohydrolase YtcJ
MVILSADPLRSPPEKIKDIRVEMTIIGGGVAWEV